MVQARGSRINDIEAVGACHTRVRHACGSIHQDICSERSLRWAIIRADIIRGVHWFENKSRFGVRKLWQWPTSTQRLRPVPNPLADVYGPKGLLQRTFWPINGNGNVTIESNWDDESGNRVSHRTTVGCT
jgi:hypothetical protein